MASHSTSYYMGSMCLYCECELMTKEEWEADKAREEAEDDDEEED